MHPLNRYSHKIPVRNLVCYEHFTLVQLEEPLAIDQLFRLELQKEKNNLSTNYLYCTYDANLTVSAILVIVFPLTVHECVEKYLKGHNVCHFYHIICFFVLFLFASELRTQIRLNMRRQTKGILGSFLCHIRIGIAQ